MSIGGVRWPWSPDSPSAERAPLAYEEFRLKECGCDRDAMWLDDIPDGNDHSIGTVRYAMMDDVLQGGDVAGAPLAS